MGRSDFTFGQFGENFTVEGLLDNEVCIGDRYRIGDAIFEVTQPRVTCYRVGIRMNEPRMAALLVAHHRPGFYFRVLQEGEVGAGDDIVKITDGPERVSVAEVDALPGQSSEPWLYAWAWENEAAGHLRSRSFPTWAGIAEDEASGAAAVLMGDRLHRALTIRQGAGSQIEVRTGTDRTIEVGGRCALVEIREHPL